MNNPQAVRLNDDITHFTSVDLKSSYVDKSWMQLINWRKKMTLKNDRYSYRVIWSDMDDEYLGFCAEFPSLSWLAGTPEAALKGIRRVVAEGIKIMEADGDSIPEPLSNKKYSGKFSVRIPPEVHRDLAIQAAEAGVSLNRLISAKLTR